VKRGKGRGEPEQWALDQVNENSYHFHMSFGDNSRITVSAQAVRAGRSTRTDYRIRSHELLGQRGELIIEHNGREYRLRVTQSGKLILTA
jgi:hemin uptake protein HemP